MNKDMIEELDAIVDAEVYRISRLLASMFFLGFMAGGIVGFFLLGGWSKHMPALRVWLIHLSESASVWLRGLS